jgi:hypothetical protein
MAGSTTDQIADIVEAYEGQWFVVSDVINVYRHRFDNEVDDATIRRAFYRLRDRTEFGHLEWDQERKFLIRENRSYYRNVWQVRCPE